MVDAAGYRWRVYGAPAERLGVRWVCHLVEILGPYVLDVPVDQRLQCQLRVAVASALGVPVTSVKPIAGDLILADPMLWR